SWPTSCAWCSTASSAHAPPACPSPTSTACSTSSRTQFAPRLPSETRPRNQEHLMASQDSFGARSTLTVGDRSYEVFRIRDIDGAADLPYSLKILLENLLRTEDGANITADHVRALAAWDPAAEPDPEIQFTPARVVMQDFTGVPCVVDLATMREAVQELGGDPARINPLAR